eukprot:359765-Chlamydomonas_euryale.AAC.1
MSATMNMIFEVQDLAVASPATVSGRGPAVERSRGGSRTGGGCGGMVHANALLPLPLKCLHSPTRTLHTSTQTNPFQVSRCGMVYVEPSQIGWRPLQASWMAAALPGALPEDGAARVNALFGWLVDPCVAFLRRNCRELAPTADIGLVVSLMQLSESLLREGFAAKGGVAEK